LKRWFWIGPFFLLFFSGCPSSSVRNKKITPFYNIELAYVDGEKYDFQDLKGKVVVIDFFNSSCMTCMFAIPHFKKMIKGHKKQGLEIVGVALGEQKKILSMYTSTHKIRYPVLMANKLFYKGQTTFGRRAMFNIPIHYVLDRCGKIQGVFQRPRSYDALEKLVKRLLKDNRCKR